MSKENAAAMNRYVSTINAKQAKDRKDNDRPLIRRASDMDLTPKYLPTGIDNLDKALGGGIAVEGITVLHGTYFTGKTALAMQLAAKLTNEGENVLYVYTETPPPYTLIHQMGVNTDHLWMIGPQDYAEEMIDAIEGALWDKNKRKPTGLVRLLIVDSLNNFIGKKESDKWDKEGAEGQNMAVRAQLIDNFMRRLMGRGLLETGPNHKGVSALMIAQNRANMDPNSPVKDVLAGGFAVKYDPKIIISLRKKQLPGEKKYEGHTVRADITKNGMLGQPGYAEYTVMYGQGVDDTEGLVSKATEWGYIIPDKDAGRGWFRIILPTMDHMGDVLIKGKNNLGPVLRTLPEVKQIMRDLLAIGKPKAVVLPSPTVRLTVDSKAAEDSGTTEETMEISEE